MIDAHIKLGAACVYRLTVRCAGNSRRWSYIGKTVQPLERYIMHDLMRRDSYIGNALRKHGRVAFKAEIILIGTEEYCFEMERKLIKYECTQWPDGYNMADGGEGFTSEEGRRLNDLPQTQTWRESPEGRAQRQRAGVLGNDIASCRAGYPLHRVLEAFKAAPRCVLNIKELAVELGFTWDKTRHAIGNLRRRGYVFKLLGHGTSTLRLMEIK